MRSASQVGLAARFGWGGLDGEKAECCCVFWAGHPAYASVTAWAMTRETMTTPPLALVILEFPNKDIDSQQINSMLSAGAVVLVARSQAAAKSWMGGAELAYDGDPSIAPDVDIDLAGHRARCKGAVLDLTEQEFLLLGALAERRPEALSYESLTRRVWGRPSYGDQIALRSAVKRLRKKLKGAGAKIVVEAVRGFGFRLETLL